MGIPLMRWLSLFIRRRLIPLEREYAQILKRIFTGLHDVVIMEMSYLTDLVLLYYLLRQLYEVAIQAAIGKKVIARET